MQSADFLSAVFFYLKEGENLNQNWIVENLNNAFSTWNGKLGELWGLVTTGPQTFKGGAVWSVMQTLHNGMVGIGYPIYAYIRDRICISMRAIVGSGGIIIICSNHMSGKGVLYAFYRHIDVGIIGL